VKTVDHYIEQSYILVKTANHYIEQSKIKLKQLITT